MNREIATRWVAALRSKKFKQATGRLRRSNGGDSFCCLGVLCELAKDEGIVERSEAGYLTLTGTNALSDLPCAVRQWASIRTSEGRINSFETLAGINDRGSTFDKIAEIIEANVDYL